MRIDAFEANEEFAHANHDESLVIRQNNRTYTYIFFTPIALPKTKSAMLSEVVRM